VDLATLIGFLLASGIILAAIVMGSDPMMFFNVPSLLVVGGGTIGAVLMMFSISQFFGAMKVGMKALFHKMTSPKELIETTIDLANTARKGGLLALEEKDTGNTFFQMGIQMMVDGHEPDVVHGQRYEPDNRTS
jgi:chemotaxis protein MotA